jgi:hypothetical protein
MALTLEKEKVRRRRGGGEVYSSRQCGEGV